MSLATILLSPFRWSVSGIPEIRRWVVAIQDCARPVPGIVCLAAGALFLIQGFRYLAKARSATRAGNQSPRRCRWLCGAMLADFVLAFAWLSLLVLDPESKHPALPKLLPVETRL